MKTTRRKFVQLAIPAAGAIPLLPVGAVGQISLKDSGTPGNETVSAPYGIEGQRQPDLGNGQFVNPVLPGDHPDPNVLKDGDDYYLSYSSFDYYPGIIIWHSRDLVNWTPIGPALRSSIGSIWALDLVKHNGRYFIYIPTFRIPTTLSDNSNFGGASSPFRIYVIHADTMRGPWSEPVDMGIPGYIDPGHIVGEDGRRYLFLNDGHRVELTADGLRAAGPVEKVYEGWKYPDDWIVEGFALEGPKLMRRGDWFYMFSGEGGTAGPPTSHMVVVARARSIHGPWVNCPHNPIVHTSSPDERWMSRGHATPVEGPSGDWWLLYHGYEKGFRTLGRQSLLEPFEWTDDGWPVARGGDADEPIRKPVAPSSGVHGQPLSDNFRQDRLGTHLAFFQPQAGYLARARFGEDGLLLSGQGSGPADSSPLAMITGDHSYEVTIEFELRGSAQGGLLLFYNKSLFCGLGCDGKALHNYKLGQELRFAPNTASTSVHLYMRARNLNNVVSFFESNDGVRWTKANSYEVTGYNHNVGDGFLSLRPALFASGEGAVLFKTWTYRAIQS
jgi:xylan 1,4-beta-xylosidase